MKMSLKAAIGVVGLAAATTAAAQVTLYSHDDFHGQQFTANGRVHNLDRLGFNDRASSAVVNGGDWQVCEDANFQGRCVILRPGEYPSLDRMGLSNEISSLRPVEGRYGYNDRRDDRAYVAQGYDDRASEPLYQAPVTSVRAVVGPPEQRCWVERRQVVEDRGDINVPGAIAGAVIGGVLGHQIGGGRGRDIATVGGAVAGGAVGANIGRGGQVVSEDVQRCATVQSSAHPEYWDVTYHFRGVVHRAQLSAPPGRTIVVDENGVPRG